jgi:hypothetical protein
MYESCKTKLAKLKRAKEYTNTAADASRDWQKLAQEDFLFRDGDQWPKNEKEQLEDDKRPVLTFNVTKSSIDLVRGLNDDNKVRYHATPVEDGDGLLVEIINKLVYWCYETYEWDLIEDDAFESAAICGRGWIAIDFGPNPKQYGDIKIDQHHISIREVHIDPASRRKDLSDASYIVWEKWLTAEDFKMKYPNAKVDPDDIFDLGYIPFESGVQANGLTSADPDIDWDNSDYWREMDEDYYDKNKRMIRVVHQEYWKNVDREWVQDPETKEWDRLDEMGFANKKDWERWFVSTYPNVADKIKGHYTKIVDKEVYWLQFVGHEILYDDKAPVPYDGFSVVPCFAYTDLSLRTLNHYGIVRLMKDAQREINKRWSQTLNLINNQVQPGLYAEEGAFVDDEQAEDAIKTPGGVAYLEPGALSKKQVQERTVPAFPNATFNLEEQAQVMLRRITGINPDLLGQDRGRQERLVILRPLFNAYKLLKRELFKRQVSIILKWMPLRQIKKILGPQNYNFQVTKDKQTIVSNLEQTRTAILDDVRNLKYNIDLEETSASMTQRMFEHAAMIEMQQAGVPADPTVMINKMDLPASEKDRWIKYVQEMQDAQSQAAQAEIQLKVKDQELKHQREMLKIMLDYKSKTAKTNAQIAKDTVKLQNELKALGIEHTDVVLDFIAKMANVEAKMEGDELAAETAKANAAANKMKGETKNVKTKQSGN